MAEKVWADMTPEEKRAVRIEQWRNPDVPRRAGVHPKLAV